MSTFEQSHEVADKAAEAMQKMEEMMPPKADQMSNNEIGLRQPRLTKAEVKGIIKRLAEETAVDFEKDIISNPSATLKDLADKNASNKGDVRYTTVDAFVNPEDGRVYVGVIDKSYADEPVYHLVRTVDAFTLSETGNIISNTPEAQEERDLYKGKMQAREYFEEKFGSGLMKDPEEVQGSEAKDAINNADSNGYSESGDNSYFVYKMENGKTAVFRTKTKKGGITLGGEL